LSYQWQAGSGAFTNLVNGGQISGATSNVLTVTGVTTNWALNYQVIVSDSYGSATSAPPATLTVTTNSATTTLINVQFVGATGGDGAPPGGASTAYSGAAVFGASGDTWNQEAIGYYIYPGSAADINAAPLANSAGLATSFTLTVGSPANSVYGNHNAGTATDAGTTNLMSSDIEQFVLTANVDTWTNTIGGLSSYAGCQFNLVVYAGAPSAQTQTISVTGGATGGNTGSALTTSSTSRQLSAGAGVAYQIFTNATLTGGNLTFTVNGGPAAVDTVASYINGFQLQLILPTNPPPPASLNATAGNAQVVLSWAASSGATSYNVKRATVNNGPYTTITNVTTTGFTNTGLANGTTYYYVVSAVNAGGESANSPQATATPVAPPATPTGLGATAGTNQVSLSWTASSNAVSYNVKRATVSGGPYTTIASPTVTSYLDTNVVAGTTYYYVVSAVNAGGESANSAQVSAMPVGYLPSPWQTQDIGTVGLAGSGNYSNGTFTITGAGTNIAGAADSFRFVYQASSADCSNTVRVATLQNTSSNANCKAGVMIRESLNSNAREAGVWVTPSSGIIYTYRTSTGGATSTNASAGKTAPYWVRIARTSNSFKAYYSTNGTAWTQLGSTTTISMSSSAYIGMGLESGVTNTLNKATMDNTTTVP
jgi:hypothetical protein